MSVENIKIACIGCGTMGGAVVKAMTKKVNPKNIFISNAHYEKAEAFAKSAGVNAVKSNLECAKHADYIFIAVKPAYVSEVIKEIRPELENKTVISMAAGVTLSTLESIVAGDGILSSGSSQEKKVSVIRIMPNLPAVYGEAMTALTCSESVEEEKINVVKEILECSGKVEQVPEKLMDGVTAISGSGPAYGFMFIEALADAAVKFGMPRKQAYIYAAQTLKGAAVMALEDSRSISELKDAVCSPAGTTIEAVVALEKRGFRSTVIEGATAAYNKSVAMSKK